MYDLFITNLQLFLFVRNSIIILFAAQISLFMRSVSIFYPYLLRTIFDKNFKTIYSQECSEFWNKNKAIRVLDRADCNGFGNALRAWILHRQSPVEQRAKGGGKLLLSVVRLICRKHLPATKIALARAQIALVFCQSVHCTSKKSFRSFYEPIRSFLLRIIFVPITHELFKRKTIVHAVTANHFILLRRKYVQLYEVYECL